MNSRRPARSQPLPEEEVVLLKPLKRELLHSRCRELYEAGWTLRSIGEALSPKRSRSTVRSWVISPIAAYPSHLPQPQIPTLLTPPVYIPKRAPSPGISATDYLEITVLAPKARKYRAGISPTNPATIANNRLTALTLRLHAAGVPVQELADAAGVTYRAMARRLGK